MWVFLVALVGLVAFMIYQQMQARTTLAFIDGDEAVVVLIRNMDIGTYTLRNDSSQTVRITNVQAMLAGEIIHVDVVESRLSNGAQDLRLSQGDLPEGENLEVQPGETFDVQLTFLGQTLGFNYVYGFRVTFEDQRGSRVEEVIDEFSYLVVVE